MEINSRICSLNIKSDIFMKYIFHVLLQIYPCMHRCKYSVNIDTLVWMTLLRVVSVQASNANKGEALSFRSFLLWYLRWSEVLQFLTLKLDKISRRKVVWTILYKKKKYLTFKIERIIWMLAPWVFFIH